MSAKTFEPTRAQRIEAIGHVVYEYANLMAAGHYSMEGQAPWRTNCDDAFLLGCRKLGDFLLRKRPMLRGKELDDVLAVDYLPPECTTTKLELPIWTKEWRDVMNKQLMHISYNRNKPWNHEQWVPKLVPEFNKAWWDFRDAVTDKEYIAEFEKQLKDRKENKDWGFQNIELGRIPTT